MQDNFRHDITPKDPPTLMGLRSTLLGYGTNVGSLVAPAMPGRRAAMMILMLNNGAIRCLGPLLEHAMQPLRGKQNEKTRLIFDPNTPVTEYLLEMERVGLFFYYFRHPEVEMLVCCLSGTPAEGGIITPDLCEALTALGCATSLQ